MAKTIKELELEARVADEAAKEASRLLNEAVKKEQEKVARAKEAREQREKKKKILRTSQRDMILVDFEDLEDKKPIPEPNLKPAPKPIAALKPTPEPEKEPWYMKKIIG